MRLVTIALAAILASSAMADGETDLGGYVWITNGVRDRYGVSIDFDTDVPPPYLVGIYPAVHAQFGPAPHSRLRPIRCRIVKGKHAALAIDTRLLPFPVFVQVLPAAWTNTVGFGEMSADEMESANALVDSLANLPGDAIRPADANEHAWRRMPLAAGCSQEVPLHRFFRSLSSYDGYKLGLDWLGRTCRVAESNAVPGRIYWEGL